MIETRKERRLPFAETDLEPIASDHVLLRDRCLRLETSLACMAGHPVDGVAAFAAVGEQEIHAELYEFRQLLLDHLANEEQAGLLELAVADAPHIAPRVERLQQEHDWLRSRMEWLLASAPTSSWVRIHAAFVAFRDALREHERAEDELMQHAYLDDLGGRG